MLVRTLVDLPEADIRALDVLGERRRVSRAKIIREAVSAFLSKSASGSADAAFGLWRDRMVDGLDYQRQVRSEW
ncbi:MAG TPA: CopG family transcriptional regulator [Caulobacteraceae bacterium]|nr:CopG family transcriptional regulator [Caulobacteraceae bacterium]